MHSLGITKPPWTLLGAVQSGVYIFKCLASGGVALHCEGYARSLGSRIVWQEFPNILDFSDSLTQLLVFEEWFPPIMDLPVS